MKEDQLKNIIELGVESTSDDFTSNLMIQVESSEVSVSHLKSYNWKVLLLYVVGIILLIMSFFVELPNINIEDTTYKIPSTYVAIFTASILLFVLYRFLEMKKLFTELVDY